MGAINQVNRFIANLEQLCAPLRPLQSEEIKCNWTENLSRAFEEIKKAIRAVTEIQHLKRTNR